MSGYLYAPASTKSGLYAARAIDEHINSSNVIIHTRLNLFVIAAVDNGTHCANNSLFMIESIFVFCLFAANNCLFAANIRIKIKYDAQMIPLPLNKLKRRQIIVKYAIFAISLFYNL